LLNANPSGAQFRAVKAYDLLIYVMRNAARIAWLGLALGTISGIVAGRSTQFIEEIRQVRGLDHAHSSAASFIATSLE
jgi:hypothetical protein